MKKLIIVLVVIAVAAAGVLVFANNNDTDNGQATNPPGEQTAENEQQPGDENDEAEVATTITYTDDGFTIDQATITAGDTVEVVNSSSITLDFSSDPHPDHTEQPELNVGSISPGESRLFVLTQPGTWGFHNHENDAHSGSITVQ